MIQSEIKRTEAGKKEAAFTPDGLAASHSGSTPSSTRAPGRHREQKGKETLRLAWCRFIFFLLVSLPGSCFALVRSPLLEEEAPC